MAEKEATVYVVDVTRQMGKPRNGRSESDLDWSLRYVWDKIASIVATERKTLLQAVIAVGTDASDNQLVHGDESYKNISVLRELNQILLPDLRQLTERIKIGSSNNGDVMSGLVLAVHMIGQKCKQLKYKKRIVVVTNSRNYMDADEEFLMQTISQIKEEKIDLIIVGVDFDDAEYGFKEEEKPDTKRQNEKTWRDLVAACNGMYGTMAEAIEELDIPRTKSVRPIHSYRGQLRLGNAAEYDTALTIDVERFPRVMIAKPPSASQFVLRETHAPSEANDNQNDLAVVRNVYSYTVPDTEKTDGKREIDREELAKGYEYGRTAVHISESDENITKLETEAELTIIGFVPQEHYERYMSLDTTNIIIAQKTNEKAIAALSSLIHALYEVEQCAVARLVKKDMQQPIITILTPEVTEDYECLIENNLPFAEDIRPYRFPPLDKMVTVSGKLIVQHRHLPNPDLSASMSEFVDAMDLSLLGDDNSEYAALDSTYSPLLHRIEAVKRIRAVDPTTKLPPVAEVLMQYSKPPAELLEDVQPVLKKLMKVADVKKVPPKVKGRKRNRETEKPLSGLDVESLFKNEKRLKIDENNAIPEFRQMLGNADKMEIIQEAVQQFSQIIQKQIKESFGELAYDRVVEELSVMRQEIYELEEATLYNDVLRDIKEKIKAEQLGGDRRELWIKIRNNKVGLIHKGVDKNSDVTEEEAAAFMKWDDSNSLAHRSKG